MREIPAMNQLDDPTSQEFYESSTPYSPEGPAPVWAKMVASVLVVAVCALAMYGIGRMAQHFEAAPWWSVFG